jgi:hypothetical protein
VHGTNIYVVRTLLTTFYFLIRVQLLYVIGSSMKLSMVWVDRLITAGHQLVDVTKLITEPFH